MLGLFLNHVRALSIEPGVECVCFVPANVVLATTDNTAILT
jgi:hypothetical protein